MKKTILLLLCGLIPLPIGWLQNILMVRFHLALPYFMLGLLAMAAWALLAKALHASGTKEWATLLPLHLPGFLFLILAMIQELVLGAYWQGFFGMAPQFFFLPILSLSFSLTNSFFATIPPAYLLSFLLMLISGLLGCRLKNSAAPAED